MPVKKHIFDKCKHVGHGVKCHRCEHAEKIKESDPAEYARLMGPSRMTYTGKRYEPKL